jgi:ribonuclease HI
MNHEDNQSSNQNSVVKKFRRSGPLDAYIYQNGGDEKNVQETNEHIPALVSDERKLTHLFTDGACTQNGKKGAKAAWAFLCVNDITRVIEHRDSGRIPFTEQQTNQRAELRALSNALNYAKTLSGKICIWSDSQYAINCASVWGPSWRRKGWVKQGGEIQHLDIIKPLVETTLALGYILEYKWVKAHKGGDAVHQFPWMFNHAVDQLASGALS